MRVNPTRARLAQAVSAALLLSVLAAACRAQPPQVVEVTSVVRETQVVVQTQVEVVTATPEPVEAVSLAAPAGSKTLVVCILQEPATLFRHASTALATTAVLEALYDAPSGIDQRGYEYQAIAFTKLPAIQDGDAGIREVEVGPGDRVYDVATDSVVTLAPNSIVTLNQLDGEPLRFDFEITPTATTLQYWAEWTQVPGLTWEDGTPVTPDDAVLSYEVAASPDTPADKVLVERTAAYEAVDDDTVRWTGVPGYVDGTYFLNHFGFLPRHAYGGLTPAEMLTDVAVNRDPLAYGPFRLDAWLPGDHIALSKNPYYWRAGEGLPRVDRLIFRFVPDTNRLIAQLVTGECHLGTQDAAFEGLLPLIRQFEAEGLLKTQLVAGPVFEHLDFNALPAPGYNGFAGRVDNPDGTPVFANREIRQAIAYCLDRQAIVDEALNGAAVVPNAYTTSDHPLYAGDDNLTLYPFDPERGLGLLSEHGWTDSDGDGVLDKNGQPFTLVHSTRTNLLRDKVVLAIQAQLRSNCQIATSIELYGGEYFDPRPEGVAFGRRYDLAQFAWLVSVEPPCALYVTDQIPNQANGWDRDNLVGYSNPEFDAACAQALQATDPEEKLALHAQAMALWTRDLPSLPLYALARIAVTHPSVTGVELDATSVTELWNVENFDLAPE